MPAWRNWLDAALVDLAAAVEGPKDGRIDHLNDAIASIRRAVEDLEEEEAE